MHDPHHEDPVSQQHAASTPATDGAARYPVGPSKSRFNGGASAPGVAEALGHQGAPEQEGPADADATVPDALPRAADEAALHRIARRRTREPVQRRARVDVRWSAEEKGEIVARARSYNIAAAHYVGAVVMGHLHGDLGLPGQRGAMDDVIDELNALRTQTARIGHNINQIARRLNSDGPPHPGDAATLDHTTRALDAVRATVTAIDTAAHHTAARGATR